MTALSITLTCLLAAPLLVAIASRSGLATGILRRVSIGAALTALAAAGVLAALPGGVEIGWPGGAPAQLIGQRLLRIDGFSALLIPLPATLLLLTVTVTPRARLDRAGLARTALATVATTAAFLSESPPVLFVAWAATTALFLRAEALPEAPRSRRIAAVYLHGATGLLGLGLALLVVGGNPAFERIGLWLVVVAVLVRKAILPFHAWLPEMFDRGRLGPAIMFSAPQMASYVAVVIIVPRADHAVLQTVAVLSLLTAVYGAALSSFQHDVRRACGYLFVSQSALVLAGLHCRALDAFAGSLVLWISSALAFAGLARCVLVVECRRGRLDLRRHHGGYEQMPLLAVAFLVLGLACTGFPGTLGFVGEEMLIEGAIGSFPVLGFAIVLASAFTGFSVMRMYFSLFCGRSYDGVPMRLRIREAVAFALLATVLLISGLAPRGIVESRLKASSQFVDSTEER